MPTILQTVEGIVTALWGRAMIRGLDGKMKPLAVGDAVHQGDVILTTPDGIVQISNEDGEPRVATRLAPDDIDTAIKAINDGDAQAAPAAVVGGGDGGSLGPGLRVARIVEGIGAQIEVSHASDADTRVAQQPPAFDPANATATANPVPGTPVDPGTPGTTPSSVTTTVTLTPSAPTVAEGGTVTYRATVTSPVIGSDLVLTLSNGQTITIPVGGTTGSSAPFAVRPDDA